MTQYKTISTGEKEISRLERIQCLCYHLFIANDHGKQLIDLLIEEFVVNRPIIDPMNAQLYGEHYVGFRAGQNDMICELKNMATIFKNKEEMQ